MRCRALPFDGLRPTPAHAAGSCPGAASPRRDRWRVCGRGERLGGALAYRRLPPRDGFLAL